MLAPFTYARARAFTQEVDKLKFHSVSLTSLMLKIVFLNSSQSLINVAVDIRLMTKCQLPNRSRVDGGEY